MPDVPVAEPEPALPQKNNRTPGAPRSAPGSKIQLSRNSPAHSQPGSTSDLRPVASRLHADSESREQIVHLSEWMSSMGMRKSLTVSAQSEYNADPE